ncbi:fungal-specific transcription factor domain-containing protein [Mycena galopus ATCC 62051]|nr:fungal-specific transcription factor domain-containing protein [Mycena galopus ATCC 62051]
MPGTNEAPAQNVKRRRFQKSCDNCKRKKVRCDSSEMPNNRCTNCINSYAECTHSQAKGKGISSSQSAAHIPSAQDQVAAILSTTTVYVPSHDPEINHRILIEVAQYARSLEEKLATQTVVPSTTSTTHSSPKHGAPSPASEGGTSTSTGTEEYPNIRDLSKGQRRLANSKKPGRFYGLSSNIQFTKTAIKHLHGSPPYVVGPQRPEFWTQQPWEELIIEPRSYVFPEDDLLESLTKIYFDQIHPIMNILHSASFQRSISDGLHLRDREFGAVVLVVCSLASRHSDDPRVFMDEKFEHSCGWKWFQQVRPRLSSFWWGTSLHQLQLLFLSAIFLSSVGIPDEGWVLAGLGVRLALCGGAHQRAGYEKMEPLAAELYRRVFWILCSADMIMSLLNGRPSIMESKDLDVDLPLACDEEYWGIPNGVQPENKPSSSAYLPVCLRLMTIFGRIQRAVYRVKEQIHLNKEVVQLDSELNQWLDTIPQHLKWDPHQQNQVFLCQSAALYCTYYHAQILIHRPFIPAPGKEDSLPNTSQFPSLAICANAARSCGHVLDVQAKRGRGLLHYPSLTTALFDSAVVLLINVWAVAGGRKARTPDDFARATADAQTCMHVLRLYERRWRAAGRDCDIISAMLNIGKQTLKRPREVEEAPNIPDDPLDLTSITSSSTQQMQALNLNRSTQNTNYLETEYLLSLPLLTEELGRLPVYDSFGYQPMFQSNQLHYPPRSYLEDEPNLIDPELFGFEPTLDSIFPSQQGFTPSDGVMPGRENSQFEPVSFDIPSSDSWQAWSVYLANLDGLNQSTFS